ncbi:MAG: hypothetical protein ACD_65C00099G0001 [uncultured bacterium]|nr:MAG: hypothetical protein ACD_65C00099G0001 [uncultured bacterium]
MTTLPFLRCPLANFGSNFSTTSCASPLITLGLIPTFSRAL